MIICDPGIKPKNKHLQSILASSKIRLLRLKRNNPIEMNSKEVILDTSEAKLQGFYTHKKCAKKLYILLHGWEGSAHSTYIQLLANALYKGQESSIFRLNFRDHGKTHHLNEELFHSCRLNEIVEAVKQTTKLYPHKNIYLCGFSLGANFSLRVAAKANKHKINLTKVFAISPPINPKNSMLAIENNKLYSSYFMKKWKRSLDIKSKIFPRNFEGLKYNKEKSLDTLTLSFIKKHSEYSTTDEYFKDYQITKELLNKITTPCEVITSWDDPVIPFKDFNILEDKENIKLVTSRLGGHCGFINSWRMHSWIEQYIIENS
jgi:predicted alpha/beta-fold hydrolase